MGRPGDEGLTPEDCVAAVRAALAPLAHGAGTVLAVSGGPDSVGMACLVTSARPDLRATVVHVRHGLRDDAVDAEIAAAHAAALGLPVRVVSVTVAQGAGPEDAARRARLKALRDAAITADAGWVLTGHTADDQAETVLLNIARGAGLPGLAGIPPRRDLGEGVTLLHPLLALRRDDVRRVAQRSGLPLATDPTNTDLQQRRVRARHDLLPALRALTGGDTDPVVALQRLARHARVDTEALDALAAAEWDRAARTWGPVVTLATAVVDDLGDALAGRVVRRLLQTVGAPEHPPSGASVAAVRSLRDGQLQTLPGGIIVSRGAGLLAAVPAGSTPLPERRGVDHIQLPELGVTVRVAATAPASVLPPWAPATATPTVSVPGGLALHVRARQEGDRIRTAAGTQRIAEAMVDAGVPRVARDLVPVISDEHGPLWVPGVAVREGTHGTALLSLTPSGAK